MKRIAAALWREWESGSGAPVGVLRIAVLFSGALFLAFTGVLPLGWPQQAIFALLIIATAVWLDRGSSSYLVTLTLMLLSIYSTFRYAFWRMSSTAGFFGDTGPGHHRIELVLMGALLLSEGYAFVVLLLGYLQMVWPLRRTPVPLPEETSEWPAVDVLIPTLNEPLDVVRFTALAAANMDWPADRLNVYILDDGRRDEFRRFAEEAGIGYMTRADSLFAKAGNLNAALGRVDSPFLVVFDADHVPTRSFLQVTMGWFLRDGRLGILQTPHHFYSPDPFERNLRQFRTIPNEDELFYGLVQDGNDFWNATYFCGSCAVLRRSALDEVGGMAVETVTEDAHTSMRMQRLGWNSAYINIPQAAGLATERLSEHVRQRIRWARGMVQILRLENPLFARGLSAAQRLCYLNAVSHFLYALPRLIFLTAPLMYLIFGYSPIAGGWAAIVAYAAPHLVLSSVTRSRIQGAHRHSFWTEIYETVLAPHLLIPTLFALVSPRPGAFHVTRKGSVVNKDFFDGRVALPTLLLLSFNWFGLCCALPRLVRFPVWHAPAWAAFLNWPATLYDPNHAGNVLIYGCWTVFNLILLGVASAVAWESQQRRKAVRVQTQISSEVVLADGAVVCGVTADLSTGGIRTTLEYDLTATPGDTVRFLFPVLSGTVELPATVVATRGRELRARFDHLSLEQIESLTLLLYARADRWLGWDEEREPDHPLRSLFHVLGIAARGLLQTVAGPPRDPDPPRRGWIPSVVPILTILMLGGTGERTAAGRIAGSTPAPVTQSAVSAKPYVPSRAPGPPAASSAFAATLHRVTVLQPPGSFRQEIPLREPALAALIALPPAAPSPASPELHKLSFSLPQNELVKAATLHLRFRIAGPLTSADDRLLLAINGTTVATLPLARPESAAPPVATAGNASPAAVLTSAGDLLTADVAVAPELLVRSNQLTAAVISASGACSEAHAAPQLRLDPVSSIEVTGTLIPLQDELGLLPVPFYQPGLTGSPIVQVAFLSSPSPQAARAAGILASWFGALGGDHPIRFAVTYGSIPAGNAIVLAEQPGMLPSTLNLGAISGPTLAMRTNPGDPYGKLLVLTGATPDDLVRAARTVVLNRAALQGAEITPAALPGAATRAPDDAPRWLNTAAGAEIAFGAAAQTANLDGDGSQPALISFRLPPDLFFGDAADGETRRSLPLHLGYTYNGLPLASGSVLEVWANGHPVGTLALPPTDGSRTTVRDAVVPIPVSLLRPFANRIALRFVFRSKPGVLCAAASGASGLSEAGGSGLSGSVLKESYLDIRGVPHWTRLPNLELFANAGFPFTRRADLSGTAVVLPQAPSPAEVGLLLDLLGHFGAQTGSPASGVAVTGPDGLARNMGKDVLILGTLTDQAALLKRPPGGRGRALLGFDSLARRSLGNTLPIGFSAGRLQAQQPSSLLTLFTRWRPSWLRGGGPDTVPDVTSTPDALIEAVEWPRSSRHSAVLVLARDNRALPGLADAFLAGAESSDIAGPVTLLRNGRFQSYQFDGPSYMLGRTTPLMSLSRLLGQLPWLVAMVSILFCVLIASLLRTMLRRGARVRLQGSY